MAARETQRMQDDASRRRARDDKLNAASDPVLCRWARMQPHDRAEDVARVLCTRHDAFVRDRMARALRQRFGRDGIPYGDDVADDVANDFLRKFFSQRPFLRLRNPRAFQGWLFVSVLNAVRRRIRDIGPSPGEDRRPLSLDGVQEEPVAREASSASKMECLQTLVSFLKAMGERCRILLTRARASGGDLPPRHVAALVGLTAAQVPRAHRRCKRELLRSLQAAGYPWTYFAERMP